MNWENELPEKLKKPTSDSWMIRPSPELRVWINAQTEKHPGVSGNKIIVAILTSAMKEDIWKKK